MDAYMEAIRKYAQFSGRSTRREYWMFVLVNIAISVVLSFFGTSGAVLSMLYALAVLVPGLAVSIRRLHDTDRSGWWLLIGLIPILGAVALIVFMAQDSDAHENHYGPNPKLHLACA